MQQRLFEITYILVDKGFATAQELAHRFGVSTRTIYRDIDALSLAGIPVYTEKGKGGGIKILQDFVLDKSLFSKQEQKQLVAHFQGLSSMGTPDTQNLLNKLSALFGQADSWLEVEYAPWNRGDEARNIFRTIRDAIFSRVTVVIDYTNAEGVTEQREVEPHKISFRGMAWYMHGFCRNKNAFRMFRLSRITAISQTNNSFIYKNIPSDDSQESQPDSSFYQDENIQLKISQKSAYRVYDEFPKELFYKDNNGDFIVNYSCPRGNWLLHFILSFGDDAQVISPEWLRNELKEKLNNISKLYKD